MVSFKLFKIEHPTTLTFFKDVALIALIIIILLSSTTVFARQWPPIWLVSGESMFHEDNNGFGNIGTLDAGDIVIVQKITTVSDVVTYYQAKQTGYVTYGMPGDVILFKVSSNGCNRVLHRAIAYVELNYTHDYVTYDIPELGYFGNATVHLDEFNLTIHPKVSGFITKGDANAYCDQSLSEDGLSELQPIELENIIGVARGEIPWIGITKILIDDSLYGNHGISHVSPECFTMYLVFVVLVVFIPIMYYICSFVKKKQKTLKKT